VHYANGDDPWVVLSYVLLSGLCALAHAAEQTITRTVENFTLGMHKDQAFAVLLSGIKQHHLTLVDTAQTPSPELMERLEHTPMDAVGQRWIAPQSADVLYTLNALLFDAQEFKDPVVNSNAAGDTAGRGLTAPPMRPSASMAIPSASPRRGKACGRLHTT
jgi:hypothetical protein